MFRLILTFSILLISFSAEARRVQADEIYGSTECKILYESLKDTYDTDREPVTRAEIRFRECLIEFNSELDDLYDIFVPVKSKQTKRSFYTHGGDTLKCFPAPEEIGPAISKSKEWTQKIKGKFKYVVVKKKYRYLVERNGDDMHITVRIHFRDGTDEMKRKMEWKLERAEQHWNKEDLWFMPGIKLTFHFEMVEKRKGSDFSVKLQEDYTRGPYDTAWTTQWSSWTVAHELGHMMGLGDEYSYFGRKNVCDPSSMMCQSFGNVHDYHYYFIFRRFACLD